ncbi:MAG TPA: penicillin-binding transpeptidase domain-containing protein, partial [bacterium]|nr:penicillin-binding transpeptidase domain-containing protein [bacterium]
GKARARGINTGDHAWFVAYAPVEAPRIAVSCIVEHGGFGASAAAPIVRAVVQKYLELQGVLAEKATSPQPPSLTRRGKSEVKKDVR